ncbi:division plane positioning ATPase MipZ [Falsiroseomonas sp. HC035]|uniref:division plane positioning ATPase MipZ n=1 Tax=Falsiroseomonas sp. HC035 TaxID=3390999 RepID=UPI003D311743
MCSGEHARRTTGVKAQRRAFMFVLALVAQKGGSGKSTMAIHLAVEGHRRGLKTLLIDIDTQASAAKIMDRRGDDPPDVTTEAAGRLEKATEAARSAGYDFLVVDTAPQADRAAAQAAKVANLVLSPVQPSIVDLDAVDATIDVCKLANVPIMFVLNRVPTQGQEITGTVDAIRKRGMQVSAVRWGERKAFRYPFMKGLTAQEVEPSSKAASEVKALFDALQIPTGAQSRSGAGAHVRMRGGAPARMTAGMKV